MAERYGKGDEVLALHGWARDRHDWASVLDGFNAVAVDLPGFGASKPPRVGWSTSEYASNLLPALVTGQPKVLVGHSFGGRVALHLASMAPTAVSGLVLTGVPIFRNPTSGSKPTALAYRVFRSLERLGLVSRPTMERYRRRYGSADYLAAEGVMREILVKAVNEDYSEQIKAIAATHIPTAMVWGERDTAAPTAVAEQAAKMLGPTATIIVVPGVGHLLSTPLISEIRQSIERFLQ